MAFIIISLLTLIIVSLLFNMGRMAFQYMLKMFNIILFAILLILFSCYVYWPDETALVLGKLLGTFVALIRGLAEID